MKLIRRKKKSQTPFERATGFVKLGVKGLVVQRAARRVLKIYKFARRAIPLAALAAIGAAIAKKVRGGGETPATTGYTPPQSGSGNATGGGGGTAPTDVAAAATAATGTPPVNGDTAAPTAPSVTPDDGGKEAAAPGVGDEQPSASGAESGETSGGEEADSAYDSAEKGETPTDGELEVEGPNESTPPPPEKTKK